jgi:hypothetical protein
MLAFDQHVATDTVGPRSLRSFRIGAVLTFVVAVRHPRNSPDWRREMAYLRQTVRSIARQKSNDWRAVVVANREADVPPLPRGVDVVRVDYPPNPLYVHGSQDKESFYDAVRLDKGRRLLAGLMHAERRGHFMTVDDDDLVSDRLAEFVGLHEDACGWYLSEGYFWSDGGRLVYRASQFSKWCGTSLIVRADLYGLPAREEDASETYVKRMLGSHIFIADDLARGGTPLAPLPFPGAIYRIGHRGAHSQSSRLAATVFLKKKVLSDPRALIDNVRRLRPVNGAVRDEFFHGSPETDVAHSSPTP